MFTTKGSVLVSEPLGSLRGADARTPPVEDQEAFHTCFIIDLEDYRRRKAGGSSAARKPPAKPPKLNPPHIVTLMIKARAFQELLDDGDVETRAELARLEGVSRPRVTQIMKLLRLAPEIQEAILALPPGTPERLVTERKLRAIIALDPTDQIAAFEALSDIKLWQVKNTRRVG